MTTFLFRLGRSSARHPWRVLLAWVAVVAVMSGLAGAYGGTYQDDWDVPGARAQRGIDLLREHTPGAGNAGARVVVHDRGDQRLDPEALQELRSRLSGMDHVAVVSPPRLDAGGDTALLSVQYDVATTHPDLMGNIEPLDEAVAAARGSGLQVELGGDVPETAQGEMRGTGELIGVLAALFILVLVFGSVVAAGLPVAVAVVGLAAGSGGLTLLAAVMDVSPTAPTVATMVGLGVGIDYALLLVTRHVEYLRDGHDVPEAAGRAAATAGRSVVFASSTVLVSLLGLRLSGLPTFSAFGFATAVSVVFVAASALTLVPALCRLAGRRLLARSVRRGRAPRTGRPVTARWAQRVGRRPLPWALAATLLLLGLAAPMLTMRTWPQDASSTPETMTPRRAHDLVSDQFGPGANGPMTVVVDRAAAGAEADRVLEQTVAVLGWEPRVVGLSPVVSSRDGAISILQAEPSFGPTDDRVPDLVADLRRELPHGVELTGTTPYFQDISAMLADRLWLVIGFVVAVSVLLLGMMFRSVLVPLKAALMNLLSIGAAYGVLTAVFQWGWGVELLGVDHAMPVSSWLPMLMFAILFGLSMDYEVFLLSRIREDWLATGDARGSVVSGLASTGRVISSAAAIMVAVFLGFATEADPVVKQLGLGMAVAVLVDATVVRMVLVPATMAMLGRLNWWMPAWLDRLLPALAAEGGVAVARTAAASDSPRIEHVEPAVDGADPAREGVRV
jgi:RND superfamily putative drug exporter